MSDDVVHPPVRLLELTQWQVSKVATLGARLTSHRIPLGGRADFAVLAALEEFGPLSQAELGRRLGLDRNDVNVVINRLQQAGLVDRQANPADRRRNTITINPAGTAHLAHLQAHADSVQNELLNGLSERERRQFQKLLTKILTSHAPEPA